MTQINKTSILHSFLFAIFPILHLYSINLIEASINDIVFPIITSISITGILLIVSRLILKDWTKSGFIISFLLVLSFSYGHIYYFVNGMTLNEFEFFRHRYLLLMFLVTFVTGAILIVRTQNKLHNLKKVINAVAITLIIITIPNFAFGAISALEINENVEISPDSIQLQNHKMSYELINLSELNSIEKPDIYYILLDGYGGTKIMKQDLDFDNYGFLSELTNKGFFAPDSSFSNYPSTLWVMSSLFSMNYLPSPENSQSDAEYNFLLSEISKNNEVMRNFDYLGYEIINFQPKGFVPFSSSFVDQTFCQQENLGQTKFGNVLLRTTILSFFYNQLLLEDDRTSILCGFSEISDLTEKNDNPIFVYMHLRIPHPPHVFGPNGEYVIGGQSQTEEGSFIDEQKYVDSIKFANKKILKVVENILENNEKSIIIIQSDHGFDFGINYENPSDRSLKQRFSNINAIYSPDADKDIFYEGMTPVNTFRMIFNEYFDASYVMLEDRMYYHPYGSGSVHKDIIFKDVTEDILN